MKKLFSYSFFNHATYAQVKQHVSDNQANRFLALPSIERNTTGVITDLVELQISSWT